MEINLIQSLDPLELSQATVRALKSKGIFNLEDLKRYTLINLAEHFNYKTRNEIVLSLKNMDLCLSSVRNKLTFDDLDESVSKNESLLESSEEIGQDKAIAVYTAIGLLKEIKYLKFPKKIAEFFKSNDLVYLGDLVVLKQHDLLEKSNLGKKSVLKIMLELFEHGLGLETNLKFWPIENIDIVAERYTKDLALLDNSTLKNYFFESIVFMTNARDTQIFERRLGLYVSHQTLEKIASVFNITRERVRQIQKRNLAVITGEFWCKILNIRIERIISNRLTPLFLDQLANEDPWFDGFEGRYSLLETILCNLVTTLNIKFIAHGKRKIVTTLSNEDWLSLQCSLLSELEYNLDVNYTSDDIDLIVESRLASLGYSELSDLFLDILTPDLHFVVSGGERVLTSIGNSLSSRLKALLEQVEKPLHYTELAKMYEQHYGVSVGSKSVHSCLVANDFLLFDRGTYGRKKHLGISLEGQAELRQKMECYILKGEPGRQWHAKNLVEEFKGNQFGEDLDIYTVNILLSTCKQLRYLGRNAWKVKVEGYELDERLEIHTVVYKVLKEAGGPLSSQELQERVAKERGMGNFFNVRVTDLYSRVDEARWGLLARDFMMTFEEQKKVKDFFYTYFMEVKVAAYKNELVNIFCGRTQENVTSNHIFGVLVSDSHFKSWHGGYVGLSTWPKSGRMSLKEAIQSLSEQTHEARSLDSIISILKQQLDKSFSKGSVKLLLSKNGFEYNRVTGLWESSHAASIYDKSAD